MFDFRDNIFYSDRIGDSGLVPISPSDPETDPVEKQDPITYEPHTWQAGDVITAARLNNIEDGVAAASKRVPIVTIINNSTFLFTTVGQYYISDGILWQRMESDLAVPANATTRVVRVPLDDTGYLDPAPAINVMLFDGDSVCTVTSDTMNVERVSDKWGSVYWRCTVDAAPIPDDMTIIISDPPIGEERTVAIQAGNSFVHNLPETVTGRVNEVVTITGVTTAGGIAGVQVYYDESAQLGDPWIYTASGTMDNTTITFRMPSMDTVSDTGYIQISGDR